MGMGDPTRPDLHIHSFTCLILNWRRSPVGNSWLVLVSLLCLKTGFTSPLPMLRCSVRYNVWGTPSEIGNYTSTSSTLSKTDSFDIILIYWHVTLTNYKTLGVSSAMHNTSSVVLVGSTLFISYSTSNYDVPLALVLVPHSAGFLRVAPPHVKKWWGGNNFFARGSLRKTKKIIFTSMTMTWYTCAVPQQNRQQRSIQPPEIHRCLLLLLKW